MKVNKLNIRYIIAKNRIRKDLKAPLMCRLTYLEKRKSFSTGQFVNSNNWNSMQIPNHPKLRLIRTSVIKNWLKTNDLRTVQYYAGHTYISSTERYVTKDIEHLKKQVLHYHPM